MKWSESIKNNSMWHLKKLRVFWLLNLKMICRKCVSTLWEGMKKRDSQQCPVAGQQMGHKWKLINLHLTFLQWSWLNISVGCPVRMWILLLWICSACNKIWTWATFSNWLYYEEGYLLHSKEFCDSVTIK